MREPRDLAIGKPRALITIPLAAVLSIGLVLTGGGRAEAATCSVPFPYLTIQSAVNDPNCTTINVAAGAYAEDVTISRSLTLRGAQAGNSVTGRTFPSGSESTVTGTPTPNQATITIQAANVVVDGFSVSNLGEATGILVKTAGNAAFIVNNIIDGVGGSAFPDNTQAVYLEYGPDNVRVIGNRMRHIESVKTSNGGVFIGDSTSTNSSLNILIARNTISDVHSTRGAYAIHVNAGSTAQTASTTVAIWGNTISDLTGGWAHAIGLEGDTPGVIVRLNTISNLNTLNPLSPDKIAVWFEANPSFASGHVNQNNLNVTPAAYGIAVLPTLTGVVDGECNWWGDKNGPGPIGPNPLGAKVSAGVDFTPWLTNPAPSRCGPPPPPKCKPGERDDGEGNVDENDNNGHHRGQFKFDECNGDQEVSHQDSDRNVDFHSDSASASTPSFDAALPVATTTGQGWNNGEPVTYTLVVTDLGVGPLTDLYSLTLSDASGVFYSISGTLTAGDINVSH